MWNSGAFQQQVPKFIKIGLSYSRLKKLDIFQKYWNKASTIISPSPDLHLNCTAMVIAFLKDPVWIQVPCNKPMLYDWTCKTSRRSLQNETNKYINKPSCKAGWIFIKGNCYKHVQPTSGESQLQEEFDCLRPTNMSQNTRNCNNTVISIDKMLDKNLSSHYNFRVMLVLA